MSSIFIWFFKKIISFSLLTFPMYSLFCWLFCLSRVFFPLIFMSLIFYNWELNTVCNRTAGTEVIIFMPRGGHASCSIGCWLRGSVHLVDSWTGFGFYCCHSYLQYTPDFKLCQWTAIYLVLCLKLREFFSEFLLYVQLLEGFACLYDREGFALCSWAALAVDCSSLLVGSGVVVGP